MSAIGKECHCCCNQERKVSSASLLSKSLGKLFLCFKLVLHKIWQKSEPEGAGQGERVNAAELNVQGQNEQPGWGFMASRGN